MAGVSPLLDGDSVALTVVDEFRGDSASTVTQWTEFIGHLEPDVDVLATFDGGVFPGGPAITRRILATGGTAWYLATEPDAELLAALLLAACAAGAVRPAAELTPWPLGLEIVVREDAESRYVFAINSGAQPARIGCAGVDLLTGAPWAATDELGAGQVAVVTHPMVRT